MLLWSKVNYLETQPSKGRNHHHRGDKKGRPKNPKDEQPVGTKKKRERDSPSRGRKL
jgi:hypothetical protein